MQPHQHDVAMLGLGKRLVGDRARCDLDGRDVGELLLGDPSRLHDRFDVISCRGVGQGDEPVRVAADAAVGVVLRHGRGPAVGAAHPEHVPGRHPTGPPVGFGGGMGSSNRAGSSGNEAWNAIATGGAASCNRERSARAWSSNRFG